MVSLFHNIEKYTHKRSIHHRDWQWKYLFTTNGRKNK